MPLIAIEEAQRRLFANAVPLPIETVPITAAAGRWAAGPVVARRTQPAADLSAMDGYAIRFADLPGPWTSIGESAAGRPFTGTVGAGETVRIFTGAAMPAGTDTVMVQEEVVAEGGRIVLTGEGPRTHGRNTRRRGLDFSTGDTLVEAGDRLTPARLAVAITGGARDIAVRRKVRVALLATGDELVAPGTPVEGLSLPESNSAMLAALLADLPVEIVPLGIVRDDLATLTAAFRAVDADVLVTTGGASVGDHDLIRPAIEAAGGTIDFWRIALRPGKPMIAGRLGGATCSGCPAIPSRPSSPPCSSCDRSPHIWLVRAIRCRSRRTRSWARTCRRTTPVPTICARRCVTGGPMPRRSKTVRCCERWRDRRAW